MSIITIKIEDNLILAGPIIKLKFPGICTLTYILFGTHIMDTIKPFNSHKSNSLEF